MRMSHTLEFPRRLVHSLGSKSRGWPGRSKSPFFWKVPYELLKVRTRLQHGAPANTAAAPTECPSAERPPETGRPLWRSRLRGFGIQPN